MNVRPEIPISNQPQLSGQHFRITVLELDGFVSTHVTKKDEKTGEEKVSFSGYLISLLEHLSREDRGNFTYTLLPPSGFGSLCEPRLDPIPLLLTEKEEEEGNATNATTLITNNDDEIRSSIKDHHPDSYHPRYHAAYKCGESDVNDRPLTAYSTDMYVGAYFITPERLLANKFTIPYSPPDQCTLGMVGTATHIVDIPDLAERNSELGYSVCGFGNTAYMDNFAAAYPTLDVRGIPYKSNYHQLFSDGTCDILIASYPELPPLVTHLYNNNQCLANGKPVGVIGKPLDYGLNYFSFGVRSDLPENVLHTLNYWLMALMACFPDDPDGFCPRDNGGGSLSELFAETGGGTGDECGYVQFPQGPSDNSGLAPGIIVAIVLSPIVLIVTVGMICHMRQLKKQKQRLKKRFIQQLARNIDIGPSAHYITVDQLAKAFEHIGGQDGMISKDDLAKWMNDLHLDFLSESEFDRLWETVDIDKKGLVDPIDFVHFLGECGPQFKEVHAEYVKLSKSERMKFSSRRLSHITGMTEDEVRKMERRNNKASRRGAALRASSEL